MNDAYRTMWESFGEDKGCAYLEYKFTPTHRVGLTNFLREKKIHEFLEPKKTDRVLDVGCAAGRQIFRIAHQIQSGTGVDIAQSFVDAGNQYKQEKGLSNVEFHQAFIEHLPFADASFDKVMCAEVLEHVFDKDVALTELRRVLKPGGWLILSVPNLNADATWWGRLMRFFGKRKFVSMETFSIEEIEKHGDAHVREFSHRTMRDWLTSRGLKIKKITSVSFLDGPLGDFLLKIPLHIAPARAFLIWVENFLSRFGGFWGRHLVIQARKE